MYNNSNNNNKHIVRLVRETTGKIFGSISLFLRRSWGYLSYSLSLFERGGKRGKIRFLLVAKWKTIRELKNVPR